MCLHIYWALAGLLGGSPQLKVLDDFSSLHDGGSGGGNNSGDRVPADRGGPAHHTDVLDLGVICEERAVDRCGLPSGGNRGFVHLAVGNENGETYLLPEDPLVPEKNQRNGGRLHQQQYAGAVLGGNKSLPYRLPTLPPHRRHPALHH